MAVNRATIVGVFDERAQAERAIQALNDAGVPNDRISYSGTSTESGGFMSAIKNLFGGQSTSAEAVRDDLINMGLSRDEADYYAQAHQEGRSIVAVSDDGRYGDIMSILRQNGAHDFNTRGSATRATAYDQTTTRTRTAGQVEDYATTGTYERDTRATGTARDVEDEQARTLRLRAEQLQVEKERVQAGEVRLHKEVVAEQRNIDVPVTHEEVYIEERPIEGGRISNAPIGEGETIRVPVREEQVNVTKETVVTGEVELGKRTVQETQHIRDTVRREEARLEKEGDVTVRGTTDPRLTDDDRRL